MPPRSPLPPRHGLAPAWAQAPPTGPRLLAGWLTSRGSDRVDVARLPATGRFVLDDGTVVTGREPFRPHAFVFFHRDLRPEPVVPGWLPVLYRDQRLVVVDKPHVLASAARGRHVVQSVVVRAREELGPPGSGPAHRQGRETAAVLMLTTSPYQQLFERRAVVKTYEALAPCARTSSCHSSASPGSSGPPATGAPGRCPASRTPAPACT